MRKIHYIFIDSDDQSRGCQSRRDALPLLGYHYIVNSEGLVLPSIDIRCAVQRISGPIYDPDKYNRSSIFIRYCGSIRTESWLMNHETLTMNQTRRKALLELLFELRKHFSEAKILATSEIDGKALHARNIIVSDAMNVLRRELSDLP